MYTKASYVFLNVSSYAFSIKCSFKNPCPAVNLKFEKVRQFLNTTDLPPFCVG